MTERPRLPTKLTLPSGRALRASRTAGPVPVSRREGEALFEEVFTLIDSGAVRLIDNATNTRLDGPRVRALPLADFHFLRALFLATGDLEELSVPITCANCHTKFAVQPAAHLALGPYIDGDLSDAELDHVPPFGEAVPLDPPLPLGPSGLATEVAFDARCACECLPLYRALVAEDWKFSAEIVTALGIRRLESDTDPVEVAASLDACTDDELAPLFAAFLDTHYAPRLVAIVRCPSCRVRRELDVPYEREFARDDAYGAATVTDFVDALEFERLVESRWLRLSGAATNSNVVVVVEHGPAACDDAGDALMGSYDPPVVEDFGMPGSPPLITLYYATFRSVWDEEGPYDVLAEVDETLSHELLHHGYYLDGDDPMDDEERAQIDDEARRVHGGNREFARRASRDLWRDLRGFFARTWVILVVVILGSLAAIWAESR